MGKVSNDDAEGLGLSLTIYLAAIGAAVVVLSTPIYFATRATRLENPGVAAYQIPPRVRLIPEVSAKAYLPPDLSAGSGTVRTKVARR
jgi:hypothetical protein